MRKQSVLCVNHIPICYIFANKKMKKVLLILIATLLVCGCHTTKQTSTVKETAEKVASADSSAVEKDHNTKVSDQLHHSSDKSKETKDSVFIKEEVRTRVDASGNVTGKDSTRVEIRFRESKEQIQIKDSLAKYKEIAASLLIYKHKYDSLTNVLKENSTIKETKEVKKTFPWFSITSFFIVLIVILLLPSLRLK